MNKLSGVIASFWEKSQEAELSAWRMDNPMVAIFSSSEWSWEKEVSSFGIQGLDYIVKKDDEIVLEVGCGPFGMIHYLTKGAIRIGLDPLSYHLLKRGFFSTSSNIRHIAGMGEFLPFKSDTVDVIICFNVLDHMQSPLHAVKEIRRVLKKGGRFFLILNTIPPGFNFLAPFLRYLDKPHPHHLTHRDIRNLISHQNLGIIRECVRHQAIARHVGLHEFLLPKNWREYWKPFLATLFVKASLYEARK